MLGWFLTVVLLALLVAGGGWLGWRDYHTRVGYRFLYGCRHD
ncbi:MAG: hypothetical protein WDN24_01330 [Sphingomonas sp.]